MKRLYRDYAIERDENGLPAELVWRGDYEPVKKPTKAEKEAQKLADYEKVYGKREEP